MYETVKVVKGHAITRMIGSHGTYWITLREITCRNGKVSKVQMAFKTIKAAAAYLEANF